MGSEEDTYNTIFHALKHPIRRRILRQLESNPATFTDLLDELGSDNGLLNDYLNNLNDLITIGSDERYRLSEFGTATLFLTRRVEEPVKKQNEAPFVGIPNQVKAITVLFIILVGVLGFMYIDLGNSYNVLETKYEAVKQDHERERSRLESSIVYETLKMSLVDEQIPDHNLLTHDNRDIVLSTWLIEGIDVPSRIGGYRITLMNPEEIEEKAEAEGDFQYLQFTRFDINPNDIMVEINTVGVFDAGGGMTIQFRLTGTIYQMWIA
jgi:hypothetical protein